MLRAFAARRTLCPTPGVRWISTRRELMVSQDRNTQDCTRASIATIINTLRSQRLESVQSVNEQLLELCDSYRRRNIDGLQPALEERAAMEIFRRSGLRAFPARYTPPLLTNLATARSLVPTFDSGMYLSTSQPPNNSSIVSHSLVATGLVIDPTTQAIRYRIYDPYPSLLRDLNGMYELDATGMLTQSIRTGVFVCRI